MAERIYGMDDKGKLEPMEEEAFSSEDELQALIAKHPNLLDGEQMRPGDARRWILITCEKGIPEGTDTSDRWSVDHLVIDQDAVPTLVEVKRGSNPEIRRTVVGQMLEYAAHAAQTWTADELRQTFEACADDQELDPSAVLRSLLETEDELDADSFWQRVAANLAARRLRLLFVADEIPDSLERVVEFLNGQMPNIEVLAVEVKQFRGKSARTLIPRVKGRIAASAVHSTSAPRQKLTRKSFLEALPSDEARGVAMQLLDAAVESGAFLQWRSSGVSIRMLCSLWPQPVTVAWLFPSPEPVWGGIKNASFGTSILQDDPGPEEPLRSLLKEWLRQFAADDFGEVISGPGTEPWAVAVPYEAVAEHIDLLVDRLRKILSELRSI